MSILKEIGERLNTQDNLCTADPIFFVMDRKRIYGLDPQWTDNITWVRMDGNGEADAKEAAFLEAEWERTDAEPDGWARCGYADIEIKIQPFFTQVGADRYIEQNRHHLKNPFVFVDCAWRNYEWQEVRKFLMENAKTSPEVENG